MTSIVTPATEPSPPKIQVREYRNKDHAEVIQLFIDGWKTYDFYNDRFTLDYIRESIETDLADIEGIYQAPGGNFWVAVASNSNDKIVGIVGLEKKPNAEGELRRMSVHKDYRRYGVGKMLTTQLEQWAKTNGYTQVFLGTGANMSPAVNFYQSIGYQITETVVVSEDPPIKGYKFVKHFFP